MVFLRIEKKSSSKTTFLFILIFNYIRHSISCLQKYFDNNLENRNYFLYL